MCCISHEYCFSSTNRIKYDNLIAHIYTVAIRSHPLIYHVLGCMAHHASWKKVPIQAHLAKKGRK